MKRFLLLFFMSLLFTACDSSIKADYDTIKAKKVILIGDDGNEYELKVKKDSTGNAVLNITPTTTK